jgi:LysR family transcriptional regulator, hypochlorite-specific transcription factor HypT
MELYQSAGADACLGLVLIAQTGSDACRPTLTKERQARRMEIKWLKDFLALSSEGNFRIAAQLRGVSQPAFSRRIQALEAWVGAPLIDRGTQPSQLTGAGNLFLPVAQKVVDLVDAGKRDVKNQIREDRERMSFATLSSLAQIFLPGWLKELRPLTNTSQFIVKTNFDTIEDYFAVVEENTLDFFVCYEEPDHKLNNDAAVFASLKLGNETLVPVVSPKSDGTPSWWLPDKLNVPIPCLHTFSERTPSPIRRHMEGRYGHHEFKPVYESSITPTLKAMAIEGFGLAWIPSAHIVDELASGKLVRAGETADDILVDIVIYRCLKYNEPRVQKFWSALLQQQKSPHRL